MSIASEAVKGRKTVCRITTDVAIGAIRFVLKVRKGALAKGLRSLGVADREKIEDYLRFLTHA